MSRSSLLLIDENFNLVKEKEYQNSWLFVPIEVETLGNKYLPHKDTHIPSGQKISVIGSSIFGKDLWGILNEKINNSVFLNDRIVWEIGNGGVFFSKDKNIVAKAIREFVIDNKRYGKINDNHVNSLEAEHIIERFNEIANDIENINEIQNPYFVFKGTSCDDNVVRWFSKYNEEQEEYEACSLKESDEYIEMIVLENGKMRFCPFKEILEIMEGEFIE